MKSDWSWRAGQLGSWRVGELGSQERRVIAFCVAEFKWKWIQYCIFTPKCFQKQIFHLHFLNGAIRITCPTGPKHWFCSCAMKGESRIPNPSHSPFRPPVAQRTRQPFHLPKKKKKKKWRTLAIQCRKGTPYSECPLWDKGLAFAHFFSAFSGEINQQRARN